MSAEIELRPNDDRGREILDDLDKWMVSAMPVGPRDDVGTRRYPLGGYLADVDSLDRYLDRTAADWRDHITKSKP